MNTIERILEKVHLGEISASAAAALIAAAAPRQNKLSCKVSQKGALSVYGLQRMPVTLYVEQWERLLDYADEIRKFAADHQGDLARKG